MIDSLRLIRSRETVPYHNMALEEYLLRHVGESECILYLWQNRKTVVLGRNQNCWKECKQQELEQDGGFVARRLSGGGAVYHDLGNLNFTFLTATENHDVPRQLKVILQAVKQWGIEAKIDGRNDLTVNGSKFSGNAYYRAGGNSMHHGTILLGVDMGELSRYLTVSAEKLRSKGVDSVRARVINLAQLHPAINVEVLCGAMHDAFGQVYDLPVQPFAEQTIDPLELDTLRQKFADWQWRLGRPIEFTWETSERFSWGGAQLQLEVKGGVVRAATLYSDALDAAFIAMVGGALEGCVYSPAALTGAIAQIPANDETTRQMTADLQAMLLE